MINRKVFVTVLLSLLFFAGCSYFGFMKEGSREKKTEAPVPTCLIHTVKYQGETLASISRWYTGDVAKWQTIKAANVGLDERRMYIGQEICIPTELVTNNKTYPKPRFTPEVKPEGSAAHSPGDAMVSFDKVREESLAAPAVDTETEAVRNSLGLGKDPTPVQDDIDSGRFFDDDEEVAEPQKTQPKPEKDSLEKTREELLREMLQDE